MTVTMIELDGGDGLGPETVELERFPLPRKAGVLLGLRPWPEFIPAGVLTAESVARSMARRNAVQALAICPALVSPAQTMLALAVARRLSDQRAAVPTGHPVPVITCAVRPRCAWENGTIVVPHPVTVFTRGAAQSRVIWELTDTDHPDILFPELRPVGTSPRAAVA
ncbi:hypothetical protein I6A60_06825 [Frankia sp. AgB1.9]|uniref:hypothetical protein n=1 Tax=unclassified Frankia TaxID=2632575 RepID=UPI001931729C|nr:MULTISPECIES: hypothetical protein [unclassified Frankia]MBL7492511.1 hypothetical protein [Frankia sp. AgW1.1]MBL7547586.1 hypothetical protein [Frankia sp. AgB1.9]MBL7619507.1 hypothetical protein [Frankia sp. AgB1.8]